MLRGVSEDDGGKGSPFAYHDRQPLNLNIQSIGHLHRPSRSCRALLKAGGYEIFNSTTTHLTRQKMQARWQDAVKRSFELAKFDPRYKQEERCGRAFWQSSPASFVFCCFWSFYCGKLMHVLNSYSYSCASICSRKSQRCSRSLGLARSLLLSQSKKVWTCS